MQLAEDARYALRQFANARGFTATAVLTLALGIGATTAIFSLVHEVLLKSLPVARPSELYRIGDVENCCVNSGLEDDWSLFSYHQYKAFRDNTPGFTELAALQAGGDLAGVRPSGSNHPAEPQRIEYVSGNYFTMFGIGAYMGRVLTPSDDHPGANPVAVMNYRTWQQKYGLDPSVIGASFSLDGQPFTIVGITLPGFFGDRLQNTPALWVPLWDEPLVDRTASLMNFPEESWLDLIGRIAPGGNPKAIEARLQVELRQWLLSPAGKLNAGELALVPKQTLHLSPGGAGVQMLRDEYQDGLRLLMWISAFVLLIACANVANLMLVRASARKQQTSIRAALGAPRSRQIRQVLTECAVLGLLGGTLGVALAFAGTRLILHLAFPTTYIAIDARPSLPVLGFTLALSLFTSIVFGVAPSWVTAKVDPADILRSASRSTGGRERWTQKSLVVAQASLSLVLLCAAGLLIQSLRNMQHQHFGFDTANRYILHIDPQMAGYKPAQLDPFYRQLHDNLQAIPRVAEVSFSMYSPMEGNNWSNTVYIEGQAPPRPDSNQNSASWVRVTAGYFDTIGTKTVQGRDFTDQDAVGSPLVAVVNRAFAERFFKGENPIGKHFGDLDMKYAGKYEIIGVTEDTQYREPARKVPPMFFLPAAQRVSYDDPTFAQFEDRNHYLNAVEIRTLGNVPGLEPQVRSAVAEVNPNLAVIDFESFGRQVTASFTQQEMIAKLTSLFGLLALALASVGLYGVTAYSVERRTVEIGIRMALGANRLKILMLVLGGAFAQIAIGLAIGIPATILSGRVIEAQLFGIKAYNSNILLLTVALLCLAAFVAAVIPARRAASLQPIRALRTE